MKDQASVGNESPTVKYQRALDLVYRVSYET